MTSTNAMGTIIPRLEIEHLTVEFGSDSTIAVLLGRKNAVVRAVDDVSIAVAPGETLGLVGESGSGKSTIGRTLLALNRPTLGRILLDGEDIFTLSKAQSKMLPKQIQMVFQDPYGSLNPRFSVEKTLAEVLSYHHIVERHGISGEVRRLMDLVGLASSLSDKLPRYLSGGQRQRVGLARALAVRPSVLVLDEPVAALDVSIQAQILNLLQDLKKSLNLTMLFIAHELGVVRYVSDRIAVMYLGAVMETGTTEEIFIAPKHPYTRSLLAAMPRLVPAKRSRPPVLRSDSAASEQLVGGCRFRSRCPLAAPLCATPPPLQNFSRTHFAACHFVKF